MNFSKNKIKVIMIYPYLLLKLIKLILHIINKTNKISVKMINKNNLKMKYFYKIKI